MHNKRFGFTLWVAALFFWALPVFAAPSVNAIETLIRQGNLAGAQAGIEQVIKEKPNSAKAHYLYAQILYAQRLNAQARQALSTAERLDPAMEFAKPEYLQRLRAELQMPAMDHPTSAPASSRTGGLGAIVLILAGGAVLIVLLMRASQKRKAQAANAAARTEALKQAVGLLDFLNEEILKLETDAAALTASAAQKSALEQRMARLREERQKLLQIVEALQQQKTGKPIASAYDLQRMRERLQKAAAGIDVDTRNDEPLDRFARVPGARANDSTHGPTSPEYPTPYPQRVVVERGGGSGFLTGILTGAALGSLLGQGRAESAEGAHPPPSAEPADELPKPPAASDFDLSGLGDDWSDSGGSSGDSSGFDTGADGSD